MPPEVTTIDFFRHGEVTGGDYYRGLTDDCLTHKGWQQMRDAVAERDDWQAIVSSPLRRCLEFSNGLALQKKWPVFVETGFQEFDFGEWEGKTAQQIEQFHPEALEKFYQDPIQFPPQNGETLPDFQQRIETAWTKILENQHGKSVLVVTHAGVIRMLFCLLLKIPLEKSFSIQVDHASLTRFSCFHSATGDFIQLNYHNRLK